MDRELIKQTVLISLDQLDRLQGLITLPSARPSEEELMSASLVPSSPMPRSDYFTSGSKAERPYVNKQLRDTLCERLRPSESSCSVKSRMVEVFPMKRKQTEPASEETFDLSVFAMKNEKDSQDLISVLDQMVEVQKNAVEAKQDKIMKQDQIKRQRTAVIDSYKEAVAKEVLDIIDRILKGDFLVDPSRLSMKKVTSSLTQSSQIVQAQAAEELAGSILQDFFMLEASRKVDELQIDFAVKPNSPEARFLQLPFAPSVPDKKQQEEEEKKAAAAMALFNQRECAIISGKLKENKIVDTHRSEPLIKMIFSQAEIIEGLTADNKRLSQKCEHLKEHMDSMRIGYLKELNQYEQKTSMLTMKAPTIQTQQSKDEVEVQYDAYYFDSSEGLDLNKNLETVLNKKIERLTADFNAKMQNLNEQNQKYFLQIKKYQLLTEGHEGFDIEHLSVEEMIKKLFVVCQNPFQIWQAFESLQPSFFYEVIREKYEIDENYSSRVQDRFKAEIKKIDDQYTQRLRALERECFKQRKDFEAEREDLETKLRHARLQVGPQFELLKSQILGDASIKVSSSIERIIHEKDTEYAQMKARLQSEVQRLKAGDASTGHEHEQQFQVKAAKQVKILEQIKAMTASNSALLPLIEQLDSLSHRLHTDYFSSEVKEQHETISSLKDRVREAEQQAALAEYQFKMEQSLSSSLKKQLYDQLQKTEELEAEFHAKSTSLKTDLALQTLTNEEELQRKTSEGYIAHLEDQISQVHAFLEGQKISNPVVQGFKLNPVAKLREMRAKLMFEKGKSARELASKLIRITQIHNSAQTDLRNVTKGLYQKHKFQKTQSQLQAPKCDTGTQVVLRSETLGVQTDELEVETREVQTTVDMKGFNQLEEDAFFGPKIAEMRTSPLMKKAISTVSIESKPSSNKTAKKAKKKKKQSKDLEAAESYLPPSEQEKEFAAIGLNVRNQRRGTVSLKPGSSAANNLFGALSLIQDNIARQKGRGTVKKKKGPPSKKALLQNTDISVIEEKEDCSRSSSSEVNDPNRNFASIYSRNPYEVPLLKQASLPVRRSVRIEDKMEPIKKARVEIQSSDSLPVVVPNSLDTTGRQDLTTQRFDGTSKFTKEKEAEEEVFNPAISPAHAHTTTSPPLSEGDDSSSSDSGSAFADGPRQEIFTKLRAPSPFLKKVKVKQKPPSKSSKKRATIQQQQAPPAPKTNYSSNQRVFQVRPYGIQQLEKFLVKKIDESKMVTRGVQTDPFVPLNSVQQLSRPVSTPELSTIFTKEAEQLMHNQTITPPKKKHSINPNVKTIKIESPDERTHVSSSTGVDGSERAFLKNRRQVHDKYENLRNSSSKNSRGSKSNKQQDQGHAYLNLIYSDGHPTAKASNAIQFKEKQAQLFQMPVPGEYIPLQKNQFNPAKMSNGFLTQKNASSTKKPAQITIKAKDKSELPRLNTCTTSVKRLASSQLPESEEGAVTSWSNRWQENKALERYLSTNLSSEPTLMSKASKDPKGSKEPPSDLRITTTMDDQGYPDPGHPMSQSASRGNSGLSTNIRESKSAYGIKRLSSNPAHKTSLLSGKQPLRQPSAMNSRNLRSGGLNSLKNLPSSSQVFFQSSSDHKQRIFKHLELADEDLVDKANGKVVVLHADPMGQVEKLEDSTERKRVSTGRSILLMKNRPEDRTMEKHQRQTSRVSGSQEFENYGMNSKTFLEEKSRMSLDHLLGIQSSDRTEYKAGKGNRE